MNTTVHMAVASGKEKGLLAAVEFYQQLKEMLPTLPSIEHLAATNLPQMMLPLNGGSIEIRIMMNYLHTGAGRKRHYYRTSMRVPVRVELYLHAERQQDHVSLQQRVLAELTQISSVEHALVLH